MPDYSRAYRLPSPICLRPPDIAFVAALLIWSHLPGANAEETLQQAIETQVQANQSSASAQRKIDELDSQTRKALEEYRDALRRAEALNAYNAHLRRLVESQKNDLNSLDKQLQDLESTRREVVPLMLRMLETLERFVQLDRPFLAEERTRRLADLRAAMNRADLSDADKFRRVLEAYQIENEYGKTLEAYQAELANSGAPRSVNFLRIGRVALLYQTLDGRETGVWNSKTRQWQALPSKYNATVRKGLAIARKETAPELLPIPVEVPEVRR